MKVVLLEDVKGAGKKDEVVTVSDGYARNYLLPRKLAREADAAAMNEVKSKEEARLHRIEEEKRRASETASKIGGKTITIHAKAGENGKLFGSVTSKEISEELKKEFGEDIPKNKIAAEGDIKSYGEYKAKIKIYPEISAEIRIIVKE
ncbi:MAG: 50S ribosomal protein L9 [Oscillospiraceae bacterium]|jgi:large subunit ribosomal protein L9